MSQKVIHILSSFVKGMRSCLIVSIVMSSNPCPAQETQVNLKIFAPATTPKEAQLYVTGNHPDIGNWNPQGMSLVHENDSIWTATIVLPKSFRLEFKITRGSWNQQVMYKEGEIPHNTVVVAERDTTVELKPLTWSDLAFSQAGGIVGTVRYHRGLRGEGLKHARDVIVWMPPSYGKETSKRYPVLYMHDGQNIFDPSTSFIGYDWHMDEVADSLIRFGKIEEIMIVGIYNSPDRGPEYSHTELGKTYARFVVHQVKPLIDSTYRTKPDRLNTAVMGSSMGGHISFLLAWWYPDIFYQAACLSPAFVTPVLDEHGNPVEYDDRTLQQVRSYTGKKKDIRLYMDCGGVGMDVRLKPGMDMMAELLAAQGYEKQKELQVFFDKQADHNEYSWAARVWRPLMFMFGEEQGSVKRHNHKGRK